MASNALVAELGQVERPVAPMDDQLREPAPDGRRLLQAVAREAVAEVEVLDRAGRADDGVVVEQAHVVGPGPGAAGLDRLEGGHPVGERRPDELLEEGEVDLLGGGILVVPVRIEVGLGRCAADEALALRAGHRRPTCR